MNKTLFVYGTLKEGFVNHYALRNSQCMVKGYLLNNHRLRIVAGHGYNFPIIEPHWMSLDNRITVIGELYICDKNTIEELNYIETGYDLLNIGAGVHLYMPSFSIAKFPLMEPTKDRKYIFTKEDQFKEIKTYAKPRKIRSST